MRRADERKSFAKRKILPALLVVAAGVLAFFVTKTIRHRFQSIALPRLTATADVPIVPPPTTLVVATQATAQSSRPPTVPPSKPTAPPKNVRRLVRLGNVKPQEGVVVSIDGSPSQLASTGAAFSVDDKEHEFRFACKADLCEPTTRMVGAGERDADLSVELLLKRVTLLVEGDAQREYGIKEYPNQRVRAGLPVTLSISRNGDPVTVMEFGTNRQKTVILLAGRTVKATFDAVP